MIENILVALIVLAALVSVLRRYAFKAKGGCGSGSADSCSSCQACDDPVPPPPSAHRVIPLRVER
jgi:hypothetical protein